MLIKGVFKVSIKMINATKDILNNQKKEKNIEKQKETKKSKNTETTGNNFFSYFSK